MQYLRKPKELVVDRPDRFLDRLLERTADAHNLAHALHAAAQQAADPAELLEVPARNLHHDVVQTWLEARGGHLRHRVLDLIEWNAETELSGDERERVACRFRGERGGTRQTSIDLRSSQYRDSHIR